MNGLNVLIGDCFGAGIVAHLSRQDLKNADSATEISMEEGLDKEMDHSGSRINEGGETSAL